MISEHAQYFARLDVSDKMAKISRLTCIFQSNLMSSQNVREIAKIRFHTMPYLWNFVFQVGFSTGLFPHMCRRKPTIYLRDSDRRQSTKKSNKAHCNTYAAIHTYKYVKCYEYIYNCHIIHHTCSNKLPYADHSKFI